MTSVRLPKQHGAWSILAAAFALGSWFGGGPKALSLILLAAILALFIGWETYSTVIRSAQSSLPRKRKIQTSACWLIALSVVLGLYLASAGLVAMVLIGSVALGLGWLGVELERRRKSHTLIGELTGSSAMSLIAPAAEYCASGALSARTLGAYLMCVAFFGGSVFHVRFVVRENTKRAKDILTRLKAGWPSAVYHLCALLTIGVLPKSVSGLHPLSFLAFIPVVLKALLSIAMPSRGRISILRIGLTEFIHAIIFVCLALVI